jgi:hypothetical protein
MISGGWDSSNESPASSSNHESLASIEATSTPINWYASGIGADISELFWQSTRFCHLRTLLTEVWISNMVTIALISIISAAYARFGLSTFYAGIVFFSICGIVSIVHMNRFNMLHVCLGHRSRNDEERVMNQIRAVESTRDLLRRSLEQCQIDRDRLQQRLNEANEDRAIHQRILEEAQASARRQGAEVLRLKGKLKDSDTLINKVRRSFPSNSQFLFDRFQPSTSPGPVRRDRALNSTNQDNRIVPGRQVRSDIASLLKYSCREDEMFCDYEHDEYFVFTMEVKSVELSSLSVLLSLGS